MNHPIATPLRRVDALVAGERGLRDEREQSAPRGAIVPPMMREDLEESLFRFVESVAAEPRWRVRLRRGVRGLMRAALLEGRLMGTDRVLGEATATATRWGRFRGPRLARMLDVDPTDPRSLGRIQDWEDDLLGVTGHWCDEGAEGETRGATKRETACPYADLAAEDTRFCTDLVHRLETETFRAVVPSYRLVPLTRLLSRGAAACEFRHEVPTSVEKQAASPSV